MAAGVEVLIAPLLPRDLVRHRSGRPDLLLRADDGGYHPAEIKFHRVSDVRREPATLTWSSLTDPLTRHDLPGRRFRYNWRLNDLLQLAHYHRMLQAAGFAGAEALGALIGTDTIRDQPVLACRGCGSQWVRSEPWTPAQADGSRPPAVLEELSRAAGAAGSAGS